MALGRLASHIAELGGWATVLIKQDKLEITPGQKAWWATSKSELLDTFEKHAAESRTAIESAADAHMAASWSLIYGGHTVFTLPRSVVLRTVVFNHIIHHRGQLTVYLRLNNVGVPGMYGPSADEKPQFPAGAQG